MTLSASIGVKIGSVVAATLGWGAEGFLLAVAPAERVAWMVAAATMAAVGTMGLLLSLIYAPPAQAYQLGYDVGWRDGRRAERMSAMQEDAGVVTRLPLPRRVQV